jgi:dTMP kinase
MGSRGKLIAIEGIDGSGKRTQLDLLARALDSRGIRTMRISFPRYESSFGKLVARFLNGDFGPLDAVDPHFSALLYAGDRLEARPEIAAALGAGKVVLADRYIASNLAHQTSRVEPERREEFLAWLKNVEYGIYGLPVEDLILYLHLPTTEAHRMIGMKSGRAYTALRHDLQEADVAHLEQAAEIYDSLATLPNWTRINCTDFSGALLSPDEIHRSILKAVETRILSRALAEA